MTARRVYLSVTMPDEASAGAVLSTLSRVGVEITRTYLEAGDVNLRVDAYDPDEEPDEEAELDEHAAAHEALIARDAEQQSGESP